MNLPSQSSASGSDRRAIDDSLDHRRAADIPRSRLHQRCAAERCDRCTLRRRRDSLARRCCAQVSATHLRDDRRAEDAGVCASSTQTRRACSHVRALCRDRHQPFSCARRIVLIRRWSSSLVANSNACEPVRTRRDHRWTKLDRGPVFADLAMARRCERCHHAQQSSRRKG